MTISKSRSMCCDMTEVRSEFSHGTREAQALMSAMVRQQRALDALVNDSRKAVMESRVLLSKAD